MIEILVIKPSSFGDIIHGLQVIQSLREQIGQPVRISWVVRELFAPFVKACDAVDAVFIFERKGGVLAFLRLAKAIRQKKYDYVLDMQGLARSGLLTLFARGKQKIIRSDAREGAQWASFTKAPLPEINGDKAHAVDILSQFLPAMGLSAELKGAVTFHKLNIQSKLSPNQLQNSILLFLDSRRPEKEWPYFKELTQAILDAIPDRRVIWMGMKQGVFPEAHWPADRFINLINKTQLMEVIPLIQSAELIVANDSGPMHLAAAMGKPVLALFGPTNPAQYGPYPLSRTTNHVLQAPNGDLSQLKVAAVLYRVKTILNKA